MEDEWNNGLDMPQMMRITQDSVGPDHIRCSTVSTFNMLNSYPAIFVMCQIEGLAQDVDEQSDQML